MKLPRRNFLYLAAGAAALPSLTISAEYSRIFRKPSVMA